MIDAGRTRGPGYGYSPVRSSEVWPRESGRPVLCQTSRDSRGGCRRCSAGPRHGMCCWPRQLGRVALMPVTIWSGVTCSSLLPLRFDDGVGGWGRGFSPGCTPRACLSTRWRPGSKQHDAIIRSSRTRRLTRSTLRQIARPAHPCQPHRHQPITRPASVPTCPRCTSYSGFRWWSTIAVSTSMTGCCDDILACLRSGHLFAFSGDCRQYRGWLSCVYMIRVGAGRSHCLGGSWAVYATTLNWRTWASDASGSVIPASAPDRK
jgi:hypothetical protein